MLLAIAPLVGLFLITSVGFGALLLKNKIAKKAAKNEYETFKEGEVVSGIFVNGSDWVVKVYYSKFGYEVQVYYAGEFLTQKTGFATHDQAQAWGVDYAKGRGA